MSDTKLLQTIIDNQSKMQKQIDEGFKEVHSRLDTIGLDVAQLQDDAPTLEDHEELVSRVDKLEDKVASL